MPVTFTVIVQVAAAASEPFASAMLVPPAVAVTDPAPQVVDAFGADAIVTPDGSASVNATPESATLPIAVLGMLIVKTDVSPAEIVAGANASLSVVPARWMLRSAVAGAAFETPCVVDSAFAAIVFV